MDNKRVKEFVKILRQHQIDVHHLQKSAVASGVRFAPDNSFIVPLRQNQYRLIQAIFEKRTSFQDSLFYDVSAWTLPLAFDIQYGEIRGKSFNNDQLGNKVDVEKYFKVKSAVDFSEYAYAFQWHDYQSYKILYSLHQKGLITKVAVEPFATSAGDTFARGSVIIPGRMQKMTKEPLYHLMQTLSAAENVTITGLKSGYTTGFNLGSPNMRIVTKIKPLLLIGDGVRSYDAGEVWHLLDQRVGMALSKVTIDKFNRYHWINTILSSWSMVHIAN